MPSSVIASFSYTKETAILKIVFVSGTIYEYLNVPEEVYKQMKLSKSKGIFLNNDIKGKYPFKKVE
jgi:hypothetical protein